MIDHRPHDRMPGRDLGWLKARHHFPVDGRLDPAHEPLGALFVWNDDEIAAGQGFPLHFHRDVEIVTYVRSGKVTHEDTLGNRYDIEAGNVQVMTAGTGIRHAEFNRGTESLRLFQIWLAPTRRGLTPSYRNREFPGRAQSNRWTLLASGLPEDEGSPAVPLHANARVLAARLEAGQRLSYPMQPGRLLYLVPARGRLTINGATIRERDGVAVSDVDRLEFDALTESDLIMAEMA